MPSSVKAALAAIGLLAAAVSTPYVARQIVVISPPPVLPGPIAYWVSPTGSAMWSNCRSSAPLDGTGACSLTTFRTSSVAAGDTVYFRGGAYSYDSGSSLIVPTVSGTASARIIYRAFGSEEPIITNVNAGTAHYAANLNNRDYIVIRGLAFVNFPRQILVFNGSDYNEIAYNSVSRTSASSVAMVPRGIQIRGNTVASTHNWVHHNIVSGMYLAPCGEGGDGIMVGDTGTDFDSNYNTIEDNTIFNIGHAATENFSQFNVFRRNFVHNEGFKTFDANLTGTATGGSSTTLIDTAVDFSALGVRTGTFIYVHDLSDPGSGEAYRALIASISTTTFPNDTLNFSVTTGTPTFANGHSYSIGCAYFADANPPGDGKYAHRGFHLDTKSGQRSEAYPDSILFEDNRSGYASSNPGNDGAEGLAISAGRVIARYNQFFGAAGPGVYFKNGEVSSWNRVYNNTIVENGRFLGTQFESNPITVAGIQIGPGSASNKVLNTIFYNNGTADFDVAIPGTWTVTNNHLDADGDPLFENLDLTDYDSTTLPDLDLQSGSAAVNAGTHLTTAVGAGASSTTLVVVDSLFFQDGTWGSALSDIQPDWIAIGTVSNTVQIASIDYETHTITLASAATWSNGDSVWLYKKSDGAVVLVGAAPDLGARERP